jgi:HSP20 family protein
MVFRIPERDRKLMTRQKKSEKALDSVLEDFDVYFHECFGSKLPVAFVQDVGWKPLTDVYETEREFVVRIEVGGISQEDVKLGWKGNSLIVRGRRGEEKVTGPKLYHKIEITTGVFERRITMPQHVKIDRQSLRMLYRGGILEIKMKKIASPADQTQEVR